MQLGVLTLASTHPALSSLGFCSCPLYLSQLGPTRPEEPLATIFLSVCGTDLWRLTLWVLAQSGPAPTSEVEAIHGIQTPKKDKGPRSFAQENWRTPDVWGAKEGCSSAESLAHRLHSSFLNPVPCYSETSKMFSLPPFSVSTSAQARSLRFVPSMQAPELSSSETVT